MSRNQRRYRHTHQAGEDLFNRQDRENDMYNATLSEGRRVSVGYGTKYPKVEKNPNFITMVKCQRSLQSVRDDSFNKEIFEHLDKAFQISKYNTPALYDKGLMLRRIQQPRKALYIFKQLMKDKCSTIQLSNTYEQAAFCLLDIKRSRPDIAEQDEIDYNVEYYLNKSIETSFNIVSILPSLKEC